MLIVLLTRGGGYNKMESESEPERRVPSNEL